MRARSRLVVVMLIAVMTIGGWAPGVGASDDVTIATFNCSFLVRRTLHVKYGLSRTMAGATTQERADWADDDFREARFIEACDAVAATLAEIDADVLVLTEVGDEADVMTLVGRLADAGMPYAHVAVADSADTITRQSVAILSRFALEDVVTPIPGREGYDPELDDPETERDTGISKGIRAEFEAFGRRFVLFGLHFVSEASGHEGDAQRIAQASIVRRHCLPLLEAGANVIVAGDLNDHRGQPTLRRIRGRDDVFGDLIQTGIARYFTDEDIGERWTYEFGGERRQIDHVLVSEGVEGEVLSRRGILSRVVEPTSALASDHRAFVVTLRLRD